MSKGKHPMQKEIAWIRKHWKHVEISNDCLDGHLVIDLGNQHGNGRIFLQNEMQACFEYIKAHSSQLSLDI